MLRKHPPLSQMRQDQDKTKGKKRKKKRKKTDSPHGFSVNYSKRHLLASKHTPKESPLWACNEVTTTALMKISSSRLERAFTHTEVFFKRCFVYSLKVRPGERSTTLYPTCVFVVCVYSVLFTWRQNHIRTPARVQPEGAGCV